MHIKVKNQSLFLNLMEDSILATAYFHNKDIDEFNNQRLLELQNDYKKVKVTGTFSRHGCNNIITLKTLASWMI